MKKLLIGLGILAVLVGGSYAALAMFLSPERIKNTVLPTISDVLGRDVGINGDISISLFPTFGLKLEKLYVANPADLKGNMLEVEKATVAVAVLPLLKKELEIREFTLIEPKLSAVIAQDGTANWTFEGLEGAAPTAEAGATEATPSELPLADLRINSIAIKDGTITYQDRMAGTSMNFTKANFSIKMPTLDATADIEGSALMDDQKLKGTLKLETPYRLMHGEEASLKLDASTPYADIIAEANLVYTAETTRPVFRADLTQINLAGDGFSTSGVGEFGIVWGNTRPEITANLNLGFLEVDSANVPSAAEGQTAPAAATAEPIEWSNERIDFSGLNAFDAQASLKIDQIKADGRLIGPLNVALTVVDRRLVIALKRFDIFDGQTTGEVVLNTRTDIPSASIETHLTGLQIERALPDEAEPYGASGTIASHTKLTTKGHSVKAFVNNLNGVVDLTATQVGATKFDLEKTAELHLGALGPVVTKNVSDKTIAAIKQKLTTMAFSTVFKNGNGQTVIKFEGPVLAQGGEGIVNLPAADISLRMNPLLKANETRDIVLPFYIEGPLNAPAFKPDQEGITREVARQAARIGAQKLLGKALKKGDGKLGILGNILQDASNLQAEETQTEDEADANAQQDPNPVKDLKKAFGSLLGK